MNNVKMYVILNERQGQAILTATVICYQYYLLSCGADGAR